MRFTYTRWHDAYGRRIKMRDEMTVRPLRQRLGNSIVGVATSDAKRGEIVTVLVSTYPQIDKTFRAGRRIRDGDQSD